MNYFYSFKRQSALVVLVLLVCAMNFFAQKATKPLVNTGESEYLQENVLGQKIDGYDLGGQHVLTGFQSEIAPADEVLLIEGSIVDKEVILQEWGADNRSFIIDDIEDFDLLKKEINNTSKIHFMSHGRSGELLINNKWYGANSLADLFLKMNLNTDSELYIYGCNFAGSEKGKSAVDYLYKKLKINIAASSDVTGKSGDWELEIKKGYVGLKELNLKYYQNDFQIFPVCPGGPPSGNPPNNPDATVAVAGSITSGVFLAQTTEVCIQGDNINGNNCGEDPEWRFDISIPNPSVTVPTAANISFRVCRRGDFGQMSEVVYIYDETFTEIGNIPGHPANSVAFDCTSEPICTIVEIAPCAFNTQAADGVFSLSMYTNGAISGNTVGDFCTVPPGPQADGDAASCIGDCPTYTQSVGGSFENQTNGGPMVDANCVGCNCLFLDYMKFDLEPVDAGFTLSEVAACPGSFITLTPNAEGPTQAWTVDGGTTGLSATNGVVEFSTPFQGSYNICNTIGHPTCQVQTCQTVTIIPINTCVDLAVTKSVANSAAICNNFTMTFECVVSNMGDYGLVDISLLEDLSTSLGCGFGGMVGSVIVSDADGDVAANGGTLPPANATFSGNGDLLDASAVFDSLPPNTEFEITFTVFGDAGCALPSPLENEVEAQGTTNLQIPPYTASSFSGLIPITMPTSPSGLDCSGAGGSLVLDCEFKVPAAGTGPITLTTTDMGSDPNYTEVVVLTDLNGEILQTTTTPSPTLTVSTGQYIAWVVSYAATAGISNLSVGEAITAVSSSCMFLSDPYPFEVCPNQPPTINLLEINPIDYCAGQLIVSETITADDPDLDDLTATIQISSGYQVGEDILVYIGTVPPHHFFRSWYWHFDH